MKPYRNYSLIFLSKVRNLAVFSILHMIRIRFFGPVDLFPKGFLRARVAALRARSAVWLLQKKYILSENESQTS